MAAGGWLVGRLLCLLFPGNYGCIMTCCMYPYAIDLFACLLSAYTAAFVCPLYDYYDCLID